VVHSVALSGSSVELDDLHGFRCAHTWLQPSVPPGPWCRLLPGKVEARPRP